MPRLYEILTHNVTSDPANRFCPNGEETIVTTHLNQLLTPRCTKHMKGNLKLLCNLFEKFLGTVSYWKDQFAPNLLWRSDSRKLMIKRFMTSERPQSPNLFSFGQFCDADLEVAFQEIYLYCVRSFHGKDKLTSNHGSAPYTISLSRHNFINLQSVSWQKLPTNSRKVRHEGFLILTSDYTSPYSQRKGCEWLTKIEICVKDQL
ncbi:hypothetical protein Tco_0627321 [Tanacetum coccineum]|uniref:Uncharacterized protein n=1 Tax=Tanacetum coccineum TaxID=301880 RepID=A0ABQ4WM50_9ASTR